MTTVAYQLDTTVVSTRKSPSHLNFLDGIRGLAALYVVLYHCFQVTTVQTHPSATLLNLMQYSSFGRSAVAIFIVLSGYLLMKPIAESQDSQFRNGTLDYFKRRAWRILPPYYAALILYLAVYAFLPRKGFGHGIWWTSMFPAFDTKVLVTHFLLIHNLKYAWVWRIDGPMWSVATEWQIYFMFPLLLLPIWRRRGIVPAVFAAFAVGLAPHLILHKFDPAGFWLLGLFALGMAGAAINWSASLASWRERLPWPAITAVLAGFIAIFATYAVKKQLPTQASDWPGLWVFDSAVGLLSMAFIVACVQSRNRMRYPLAVLESKPVRTLGSFSYSLYLMHAPLLGALALFCFNRHLSALATAVTMYLVGPVISLIGAYLFYLAVERPSLNYRKRTALAQSTSSGASTDALPA